MAAKANKKALSEARAIALAERLVALKPDDLSERQWCIKAGLSTSFFSNLRGTPTKRPSEPSIGNLQDILEAAGSSLVEFYGAPLPSPWLPKPETLNEMLTGAAHTAPEILSTPDGILALSHALFGSLELLAEMPSKEDSEDYRAAAVSALTLALRDYRPAPPANSARRARPRPSNDDTTS